VPRHRRLEPECVAVTGQQGDETDSYQTVPADIGWYKESILAWPKLPFDRSPNNSSDRLVKIPTPVVWNALSYQAYAAVGDFPGDGKRS
jgi:hypothetical protein